MLQCCVMCCSAFWCGSICDASQCGAVLCSVMQCVAVLQFEISVSLCVAVYYMFLQRVAVCILGVAISCIVSQSDLFPPSWFTAVHSQTPACVAVCCSLLECGAVLLLWCQDATMSRITSYHTYDRVTTSKRILSHVRDTNISLNIQVTASIQDYMSIHTH